MAGVVKDLQRIGGVSLSSFFDSNGYINASIRVEDGNVLRGNTEATVLATTKSGVTTKSDDQINYNAKGALFFFQIASSPASDSCNVAFSIEGKDPVSGTYFTMLDDATEGATSVKIYAIYPGIADTESKFTAFEEMPLPRTYRARITHTGAGSFTYSVGAMYVN